MNKVYRDKITEMVQVDQGLRLSAKPGRGPLNYLIYAIDAVHLFRLLELVEAYGYPTRRLIGGEGMEKFWILVQHQDMDLAFQKRCLRHCDFALPEKAHLTDRILIGEGKPQ
ncbi:MAG: hypothetical protein Q7S84_00025 [bacterium]|nr:hypothetical protein [bacterium]